jgi:hypothetical protein
LAEVGWWWKWNSHGKCCLRGRKITCWLICESMNVCMYQTRMNEWSDYNR